MSATLRELAAEVLRVEFDIDHALTLPRAIRDPAVALARAVLSEDRRNPSSDGLQPGPREHGPRSGDHADDTTVAVLASPAAESAPAADAGIVALTGEVASVIMGTADIEDEDGALWELPKWPTAHFGQRVEVLVRVLP